MCVKGFRNFFFMKKNHEKILVERAGQEILNVLHIFVCLPEQELIWRKEAGKLKMLHIGNIFCSPIFCC